MQQQQAGNNRTLSDEQTAIRRHFLSFFEDDAFTEKYNGRVRDMMAGGKNRLLLDIGDLLDFTAEEGPGYLGRGLQREPGKFLPLAEMAVHDVVQRHQADYLKQDYRTRAVHVGLSGPVGEVMTPRDVFARHINTLVAVEGIVTRQSPLHPRVLETVHYCGATNKFTRKQYRDQLTPMLDSQHLPTVNVMPKTDKEGNPLRTELGLSSFMDSQCLVLQEAPESAPQGQLPRQVEVRLDDDLVDSVKPGDRIVVVGMYAAYTNDEAKGKGWKQLLLANHLHHLTLAAKVPRLLATHADWLKLFRDETLARHGPQGVVRALGRSIAPNICGLEREKMAVLLQLVGGVERRAHHSHVRGDINVLLVGEPSTAKSQLLRYVMGVVPLALNTTGKGSSGVGLTAAVTSDKYTGERSLSAGAMVLADRGILCIDEFDKMSPQDRVSMHEAMEQQTVTIAKAGIHASLNARCSVLAAANPVYGFYSVKHSLGFNVGLPESLLTRFDLTFIVLDQHSSEHNRKIGKHILKNHATADPAPFSTVETKTTVGEAHADPAAGGVASAQAAAEDAGHEEMLAQTVERFRRTQHGAAAGGGGGGPMSADADPVAPLGFLRRYIHLAKTFEPKLTPEAQEKISANYCELRQEQSSGGQTRADGTPMTGPEKGFFVTARTLESVIRLATASAKLRLSTTVTADDVDAAMGLLRASVHATADAATTRADDIATGAPAATPGQATGAAGATGSPDEASDNGRVTKAHRTESSSADAPTSSAAAPTTTTEQPPKPAAGGVDTVVKQRLLSVLEQVALEQQTSAALHEVAERLAAAGTPVDMVALQRAAAALPAEQYEYEASDADDVVYFIQ